MTQSVLVSVLLLFLSVANAADTVTLTGTVRALDKDKDGNPVSVFLATEGGDYPVAQQGRGVNLLSHIDARARVTGVLSKDETGKHILTVISFYLVGDDD